MDKENIHRNKINQISKHPITSKPCDESQKSSLSVGMATLSSESPSLTTKSECTYTSRLKQRASLPCLKTEETLKQVEQNRAVRDALKASRPINPANTFVNLHRLLEIEINHVHQVIYLKHFHLNSIAITQKASYFDCQGKCI